MAEQTTLDTLYLVSDTDKHVSLEIIIGDVGQTASSLIAIDQEEPKDHEGSLSETPLGTNRELSNKVLFITTTITDTSELSNFTEMIIRLRGGLVFREFHLSKIVDGDHQSVPYACRIKFLNV